MLNTRSVVLVGIVLTAVAMRLVPHPPNFTPLVAMALFGGAHFTDRRAAYLVPLAALFISDVFIGFHLLMPLVYISFALMVGLGRRLRSRPGLGSLTGTVLASSVLFFILTNFGNWALFPTYPKTMAGLLMCYTAAIPFFGNTLLGAAFYSAVIFGGYAWAQREFPVLRKVVVTSE